MKNHRVNNANFFLYIFTASFEYTIFLKHRLTINQNVCAVTGIFLDSDSETEWRKLMGKTYTHTHIWLIWEISNSIHVIGGERERVRERMKIIHSIYERWPFRFSLLGRGGWLIAMQCHRIDRIGFADSAHSVQSVLRCLIRLLTFLCFVCVPLLIPSVPPPLLPPMAAF